MNLVWEAAERLKSVATSEVMGGPAEEVQAISVEDPSLQAERDHVIHVWLNQKLPDW